MTMKNTILQHVTMISSVSSQVDSDVLKEHCVMARYEEVEQSTSSMTVEEVSIPYLNEERNCC